MQQRRTSRRARATTIAVWLAAAAALAGCEGMQPGPTPIPPERIEFPPGAAAAPELVPLGFLTGRWISRTELSGGRGTLLNEEQWSPVRGRSMVGTFRQVNVDGKPGFFEVVTITSEDAAGGAGPRIMLRLRHFHGALEVEAGETEAMVYRLESVQDGRAVFGAVAHTAGVARVTYIAMGPDRLNVQVEYEPGSPRKSYTVEYVADSAAPRG